MGFSASLDSFHTSYAKIYKYRHLFEIIRWKRGNIMSCSKILVVSIAVMGTLTAIPLYANADTSPFVIIGYVTFDGVALSDVEVEAKNMQSGQVLTETTLKKGIYVITFGGPVYQWELGDTIKLVAHGTGTYSCLKGETSVVIDQEAVAHQPVMANISLSLDLTVNFKFTPENPRPGENVSFTDLSTGSITNWTWNFGDGTKSYEQNPSHAYENPGNYTVTLTVYCQTFSKSTSMHLTVVTGGENDTGEKNDTGGGSIPDISLPFVVISGIIMLAIFKKRYRISNK